MTLTTTFKTFAAVAVTLVGIAGFSRPAEAQSYRHLDDLAVQLQGQARNLMSELQYHYRHTGQYPHLMADSRQVYILSAHIHELIHRGASIQHIRHDVDELDSLFHHLEDLVGHTDVHPHGGHVHGHTGHLGRMIEQMEDTLHHMLEDVNAMARPVPYHGSPVLVNPGPAPGTFPSRFGGGVGHGPNRSGMSFGNDKFSIRFRF